jgi:S1-C subfamily serine protease
MEKFNRRQVLQAIGTVVAGGVAGCNARPGQPNSSDSETTRVGSTSTTPVPNPSEAGSVYTDVYNSTADSVVFIRVSQGQGTGFVYDSNHVITNAHVVRQERTVSLRFKAGEWTDGTVIGIDPHSDLAVIQVQKIPSEATGLSFIDGSATIGQEVVVIGNPFNLNGTVTTGIISGIDRSIPAPTGFRIPDAIQTDAAVNPGNSGGPIMSLSGNVVGVINSGGAENIAFGISAALTSRVVPALIQSGDYNHSYIGVEFEPVDPAIADANDIEDPRGLIIVETRSDTPASGTLQSSATELFVEGREVPVGGDIIIAVDGHPVNTAEDLGSYLALQTSPGDTIQVTVIRDRKRRQLSLQLISRP